MIPRVYLHNQCPGEITLTNGGRKIKASFNQNFALKIGRITTVDDIKAKLIKAVNNKNIINKSYKVDSYTTAGIPANTKPPKDGGSWIVPAPTKAGFKKWGCDYSSINMVSRVSVNKATSGNWKFEMSGTNDVYNPGNKGVCATSTMNPRWIGG